MAVTRGKLKPSARCTGAFGAFILVNFWAGFLIYRFTHQFSHEENVLEHRLENFRRSSSHLQVDESNATTTLNVIDAHKRDFRRKLQEKLDGIYSSTGKPFEGDLWELSDYIPQWMREYFQWHRQERSKLTEEDWEEQTKVIVMQCLRGFDNQCGGTADRLKPFLYVLRQAYESRRLLLIHWTLPARLEEFLLPPVNGLDWRVPDWLSKKLHDRGRYPGRYYFRMRPLQGLRGDGNLSLVQTRVQSVTGGAELYNEVLHPDESSFEAVYHDVWRIFFTPSTPIAAAIQGYMKSWDLVPGEYAAAHLRALYARVKHRTDAQATEWAQNAINCASTLRPGGPFLFASDHSFSTQAAIAYGKAMQTQVVARQHVVLPLHLDKADDILNRDPAEFYDVFIDLYLMGMSRCLTYNRGGFGQWALLIGFDHTCYHNQKTSVAGIGARCNWTRGASSTTSRLDSSHHVPLFQPPMQEKST